MRAVWFLIEFGIASAWTFSVALPVTAIWHHCQPVGVGSIVLQQISSIEGDGRRSWYRRLVGADQPPGQTFRL